MIRLLGMIFSGTKQYRHAVGDDKELRRMAERLRVPVKQDIRGRHLDLQGHKIELAKRYGAVESERNREGREA